ncbi:Hint domain-containing protein [Paracoccus sp. YLB-12]|uniref:Hint domain-containing protein n=1 Tax=Paracoccus maritimus TaxID=2933292 RepID=A0ABT2K7C3_9RHOB|nr:Hint domain-containing protein [Paracoccus sp. YLB-12]MCT4332423.1 Hint domain-containing protein [Paracoccus sp. YLB-12]
MPTTFNAFYLGNGGAFTIDPTEGNAVSENAIDLVGLTNGTPADPLFDRIVSVTAIDQRGVLGVLDTSRSAFGPQDLVSYTLPGASSPTTAVFEGLASYDATVTFFDGSTGSVSAVVFQDEAGNLFVAPETTANADSAVFQSGPIVSMRLNGLISNNSNLTANRNAADFITCFVAGTMIETPDGPRPVEDLREGDAVVTVDAGAQKLRWVGSRDLNVRDTDNLKPIRIRTGALGQGLPATDLLVSPQHRVLVRSAVAQRMFGTDEVLVAAKQLTALPGIEVVDDAAQVTYVHLLFDDHQLVTSNGAVSESLFTGPQALKGVSEEARAEILALFPDLAEIGADMELRQPARPVVPGRQARKLAERHLANQKPVVG